MRDRLRKLPSPALVIAFIALVAALGTGTGVALTGTNTVNSGDIVNNSVRGKDIKNNNVRGKDIRNGSVKSRDVGDNSLTGADIDESTLSLPSGGGGGGGGNTGPALVSFVQRLGANETETKTIGNFTISSATNGAGQCGPIQLQAGDLDSQRSVGLTAGANFTNLASNTTATITAANGSQAFTGVADNGSSAVSGVVGRAQQGNTCLLTGYMTGN
jgi:hypothetical protein